MELIPTQNGTSGFGSGFSLNSPGSKKWTIIAVSVIGAAILLMIVVFSGKSGLFKGSLNMEDPTVKEFIALCEKNGTWDPDLANDGADAKCILPTFGPVRFDPNNGGLPELQKQVVVQMKLTCQTKLDPYTTSWNEPKCKISLKSFENYNDLMAQVDILNKLKSTCSPLPSQQGVMPPGVFSEEYRLGYVCQYNGGEYDSVDKLNEEARALTGFSDLCTQSKGTYTPPDNVAKISASCLFNKSTIQSAGVEASQLVPTLQKAIDDAKTAFIAACTTEFAKANGVTSGENNTCTVPPPPSQGGNVDPALYKTFYLNETADLVAAINNLASQFRTYCTNGPEIAIYPGVWSEQKFGCSINGTDYYYSLNAIKDAIKADQASLSDMCKSPLATENGATFNAGVCNFMGKDYKFASGDLGLQKALEAERTSFKDLCTNSLIVQQQKLVFANDRCSTSDGGVIFKKKSDLQKFIDDEKAAIKDYCGRFTILGDTSSTNVAGDSCMVEGKEFSSSTDLKSFYEKEESFSKACKAASGVYKNLLCKISSAANSAEVTIKNEAELKDYVACVADPKKLWHPAAVAPGICETKQTVSDPSVGAGTPSTPPSTPTTPTTPKQKTPAEIFQDECAAAGGAYVQNTSMCIVPSKGTANSSADLKNLLLEYKLCQETKDAKWDSNKEMCMVVSVTPPVKETTPPVSKTVSDPPVSNTSPPTSTTTTTPKTEVSGNTNGSGSSSSGSVTRTVVVSDSSSSQSAQSAQEMHGSYIRGKTGPEMAMYPLVVIGANIAYYISRKRKKNKLS